MVGTTLLRSAPAHVNLRQSGALPLAACFALTLWARRAPAADGSPFDGAWAMTPVTETFIVQQWTGACGPPPVSGVLQPRGDATLRDDGGELTITVGRHSLRTDRCADPLPTLAPEAHSSDGHTWRTRCVTPPGDARHAVVNTAYFLTGPGAISMAETGRYEFAIRGARCVADVTRGSSLVRVWPDASAAEPPSTASPPPETSAVIAVSPPAPSLSTGTSPRAAPSPGLNEGPCDHPDEPARLEVRPSRKLVRLGAEYRFHARVLDAKNCPTTTPIQWSVGAVHAGDGTTASIQPSIDSTGTLTVPLGGISDAKFDVVATAAGRSAHASVEVTSAANFESLIAQSGLDSNGERGEPSVTILATTSLGASDARTHDGARERRIIFILIVAGLASTLGAIAVFAGIRGRKVRQVERAAQARHAERMREYEHRKRERETRHAAQTRAHVESVALAQQATAAATEAGPGPTGPLFCPSCHREFSTGSLYCPFDANRLVMLAGHEEIAAGPAGSICPTCHRGYNPGVRACPHDGDELVPGPMLGPPAAAARGKICPTCGGRFEGTAGFCGKDGTQLVLLN
jgi:hypothetical protein